MSNCAIFQPKIKEYAKKQENMIYSQEKLIETVPKGVDTLDLLSVNYDKWAKGSQEKDVLTNGEYQ